MALIEVRATVTLPPDNAGRGVGPVPGDVFFVDDTDAKIEGLIKVGYLVPVVRLAMPDDLKPAAARKVRIDGAAVAVEASEADPPADDADDAETPPEGAPRGESA